MASTDSEPISITFTVRGLGTVVVIPNQEGQDALRMLPKSDIKTVTRALTRVLKNRFKGSSHLVRIVIDDVHRVEEQVRLMTTGAHTTGGLSNTDDHTKPFKHG